MLVAKDKPVGIDKIIDKYQSALYNYVISKWQGDFTAYPRIYKNTLGEKQVPELYIGGNDYKEVYFDNSSYCFFGEADRVDHKQGSNTTQVYIVFKVDLSKARPDVNHRADEEVRLDVQQFSSTRKYGFELQSIETGVQAAFREFSGWLKDVKYSDMQPWHVFRLNFQVTYDNKKC